MSFWRKNLYLYLAIACLLGIVLIFVFDGYIGVYDTLIVSSGEMPYKIEADQWGQQDEYSQPSVSVPYGSQELFTYEITNHRFSAYQADIEVSLWQNQVRLADIYASAVSVKAFGMGQVAWTLDPEDYISDNLSADVNNDFTMVIKRGDVERRVIIWLYSPTGEKSLALAR
jgi:hypothetical protein